MPLYPWINIEIQKYQNEHKLNGVYSGNSSPKIKDGAYVIWWVQINRNSMDSFSCECW